jgi:EPS-associated MarR family transcriptional regulator
MLEPSGGNVHTEESYLQVLRLLESNPRVNQRGLAEALGISLGKTNYCLRALMSKGLIKVQNFRNSDNKLAYAYLLTPAGITEKANLTARFLKRKVVEYELLNREIEQLRQELQSSGDAANESNSNRRR